jgi:shikimate dehydrogenase
MIKLGLIGYPLGHSLSPRIHHAALRSCGLEGDYSLFPIRPDDRQSLEARLSSVRSGEMHGLNVTIPHKQSVIQFLDTLTPTARSIGAVNTIYLHNNQLVGDNTDALGFLSDLKNFLATEVWKRGGLTGLVMGSGGSARAVAYALVNDGWDVILAARRREQATELAKQFENVRVIEFDPRIFQRLSVQLIINTTPVGMSPNVDQTPWPADVPFPLNAAIYDLIYNPHETRLVRDASSQGLRATTGLGMLVEQAALAFEIWTGFQPPRAVMFDAVQQKTN